MNGFTFNGTTSQSLGLLVTALNPYNSASRRVETIEIPYRNGNLIIDSGTYDNIMVSYEVSVIGNTKATCDAINEWLSGSQGYCILSDTYNTEFFRVGYFASSIEYVLTALYKEGKATLNFDCFPQKYLNSNSTITRSATSTTTTDEGGTFASHVYPLPIELKGNTTQEGTPTPNSPIPVNVVSGDNIINICGLNLLNIYLTKSAGDSTTINGITFTINNDGSISVNGTATAQANYYVFSNIRVRFDSDNYTLYGFREDSKIMTGLGINTADGYKYMNSFENINAQSFTNPVLDYLVLRVNSGRTINNEKVYPMLVKGTYTKATFPTYEPYIGSSYHLYLGVENLFGSTMNITDRGVTITKDSSTIGFNGTGTSTGNINNTSNTFTLEAGTYTMAISYSSGALTTDAISYVRLRNSSGDAVITGAQINITSVNYNEILTATFTLSQTTTMYLSVYVVNGSIYNNLIYNAQITKGSTHQHTSTSPIELCKIGNYQDYIYKDGSKWYLHKEIGKLVLNGSENWYIEKTGTANWYYIVNNISSIDIITDSTNSNMICDHYPYGSIAGSNTNQGMYIVKTQKQVRIRWGTEDTARNFKTWLSSNNVTIIYVLATQTNTEITDATLLSQLNAIDNAMAFETSTTITQVNNDVPFLLTYTNIGSANVSSNYRGEPIITVNETGMIYWNGEVIKVNAPMTINSKTMQCYDGTENLNSEVELNEFPMLKKGNNDIGSTMALSIVPNYWKL